MSAGEPRRRPIVVEGELAERMLRAMETSVALIKDVEDLKRDRDESRDTLRGTREYDGLVARFRDLERKQDGLATLVTSVRAELTEHRNACGEDKRERRVSRREWFSLWAGMLLSIALAIVGIATHRGTESTHGVKH